MILHSESEKKKKKAQTTLQAHRHRELAGGCPWKGLGEQNWWRGSKCYQISKLWGLTNVQHGDYS